MLDDPLLWEEIDLLGEVMVAIMDGDRRRLEELGVLAVSDGDSGSSGR